MSNRTSPAELLSDKTGATAVEYGLIIGVISMVIVSAASALLGGTGTLWAHIQTHLDLVF